MNKNINKTKQYQIKQNNHPTKQNQYKTNPKTNLKQIMELKSRVEQI